MGGANPHPGVGHFGGLAAYGRNGAGDQCTVIAPDLAVRSCIQTVLPLLVAGRVVGDIECACIEVAARASVDGSITAEHVFVDGEVAGSVHAGLVSLGPNARIAGNVVCRKLNAAHGATVDGLTQPSMRLNRRLVSDLARIARNARAADRTPRGRLDALLRDGLVFRKHGATFVSLYGHLELGRRWGHRLGTSRGGVRRSYATDSLPAALAAARLCLADAAAPLSIIADDVTLLGDIETRGDLRVHGDVAGNVRCGLLFVGGDGRVRGSIRARSACVCGVADGALTAERVLLQNTARVAGKVSFGVIEVRGGATYASGQQLETMNAVAPAQPVVTAGNAPIGAEPRPQARAA